MKKCAVVGLAIAATSILSGNTPILKVEKLNVAKSVSLPTVGSFQKKKRISAASKVQAAPQKAAPLPSLVQKAGSKSVINPTLKSKFFSSGIAPDKKTAPMPIIQPIKDPKSSEKSTSAIHSHSGQEEKKTVVSQPEQTKKPSETATSPQQDSHCIMDNGHKKCLLPIQIQKGCRYRKGRIICPSVPKPAGSEKAMIKDKKSSICTTYDGVKKCLLPVQVEKGCMFDSDQNGRLICPPVQATDTSMPKDAASTGDRIAEESQEKIKVDSVEMALPKPEAVAPAEVSLPAEDYFSSQDEEASEAISPTQSSSTIVYDTFSSEVEYFTCDGRRLKKRAIKKVLKDIASNEKKAIDQTAADTPKKRTIEKRKKRTKKKGSPKKSHKKKSFTEAVIL